MTGNDAQSLDPYERHATGHRKTILLLMLMIGLGHFNRVGMSVAGTEHIIPKYGVSEAEMGTVYSGFLLCYTLAMLPAGWFIDVYGARMALAIFCFASTIFVALTGVAGWLPAGPSVVDEGSKAAGFWPASTMLATMLLVRSLMGIVNAPIHPAAANVVFEHVPARVRSYSNGLVTFGAMLGIASTFYFFGWLMNAVGWQRAFFVTSMLTLMIGFIWLAGTRHWQNHRSVREAVSVVERFRAILAMTVNKNVVAITLSYGALGYFQYLYFYWIQYYFQTIAKEGTDASRLYTTIIMLAMGVGMVIGGWLADWSAQLRWKRGRRILVPVAGLFLSGAVFELGLIAPNSTLMFAAFCISAALLGACEGAFWTSVVELGGRNGGAAAGLMNMGGNAGGTLSPYLTPKLGAVFATSFGEQVGWRLSLALAGAVAMIGAAFWFLIDIPDDDRAS